MTLRLTEEQYAAIVRRADESRRGMPVAQHKPVPTKPKRSKYGAVKTVVDGIVFDSKAEAEYYQQLCLRRVAGDVLWFIRQVPFDLPGGIKYRADFLEVHRDGSVHIIDVKGHVTAQFRDKKKQVEALYPVEIEVIKKTKRGFERWKT